MYTYTLYSMLGVVVHVDFMDLFIVYFIEKSSFFIKKSLFSLFTEKRWTNEQINKIEMQNHLFKNLGGFLNISYTFCTSDSAYLVRVLLCVLHTGDECVETEYIQPYLQKSASSPAHIARLWCFMHALFWAIFPTDFDFADWADRSVRCSNLSLHLTSV